MLRPGQVVLSLMLSGLLACGGSPSAPGGGTARPASTPSAAWGLPPAEADLASRRVRGSRVAHVDHTVTAPKESFTKAAGPFAGNATERDLPTSSAFQVQKGTCYRLYVDAEAAIRALAVVVEDAHGGTVVDEATDVVPARGAFCADESGELRVKFAAGLGQGRYALELWSRAAPAASSAAP